MNNQRFHRKTYGSRVFHRTTASPALPAPPTPPPSPPPIRPPIPPPAGTPPPAASPALPAPPTPPPSPPPTPPPSPPPTPTPPPTAPVSPMIYYEEPTTFVASESIYKYYWYYQEEYECTPLEYDSDIEIIEDEEEKTEEELLDQEIPHYYYIFERGLGPNDNVWIYPYNQQSIFLPIDYYDSIFVEDLPPNGYTPQFIGNEKGLIPTFTFFDVSPDPLLFMEVVPDFQTDWYSFFYPEDAEACLRIVEVLLPLQIATSRVDGYFEYVTHPVILGNIKHKIIDGKYTRLRDVIHDLRAIVWNMNYYLCQRWENSIKDENDLFSAVLEGQLGLYYPENRFSEITGNPERKPA